MQKVEAFIYNLVKKNACWKNFLVKVYQGAFSVFGLMKGKVVCDFPYHEIRNSFFGFHDRPSMNNKGEVISHRESAPFKNGMGTANIIITEVDSVSEVVSIKTECCNFQQGSLATWFSDNEIIYNDMDDETPVTIILNIRTFEKRMIRGHFFSLASNSKVISKINFARFGKGLTGYGYDVCYSEQMNANAQVLDPISHDSDFVIQDVSNNTELYRLSVGEAKALSHQLIDDGYFYFSHSNFSPDSNKVYFLLRSSNKFYNSSQLFVYDLSAKKLQALPSGGMVSHLSWLGNERIIAFCNTQEDQDYAYYVFDLKSNETTRQKHALLTKDGHPHALDENVYFTDTYPDKERRQHLFKVDAEQNQVVRILSVYSPMKFRGVIRVDFHPRLSLCKQYLTIDTSHNKDRSQMIIPLNSNHQ